MPDDRNERDNSFASVTRSQAQPQRLSEGHQPRHRSFGGGGSGGRNSGGVERATNDDLIRARASLVINARSQVVRAEELRRNLEHRADENRVVSYSSFGPDIEVSPFDDFVRDYSSSNVIPFRGPMRPDRPAQDDVRADLTDADLAAQALALLDGRPGAAAIVHASLSPRFEQFAKAASPQNPQLGAVDAPPQPPTRPSSQLPAPPDNEPGGTNEQVHKFSSGPALSDAWSPQASPGLPPSDAPRKRWQDHQSEYNGPWHFLESIYGKENLTWPDIYKDRPLYFALKNNIKRNKSVPEGFNILDRVAVTDRMIAGYGDEERKRAGAVNSAVHRRRLKARNSPPDDPFEPR